MSRERLVRVGALAMGLSPAAAMGPSPKVAPGAREAPTPAERMPVGREGR
jgi:hypothetical protein